MGTVSVSLPSDGDTAEAADYNTPISTLVNEFNGNIDNANISSSAAISGSKLASDVPTTKLYNPYKFSVYSSTTTTVAANSTPTKIALQTKIFDTGSSFDNTTSYRFVAPIAGFYSFSGQITDFVTPNVDLTAFIYKNGSSVRQGPPARNTTGGNSNVFASVNLFISLAASDYIELYAVCDQGSSSGTVTGAALTYLEGWLVSAT